MTGDKRYELSNHLGNVLVVINDKKIPEFEKVDTPESGLVAFNADVLSYSDYYPFGMLQEARHGSKANYRYGFNGMEKDDELKGEGNSYDFGARMMDPRVGRWFATDVLEKEYNNLSPYAFVANTPLTAIDPDGKRIFFVAGAGNDAIGWNYVSRWAKIFSKNGLKDFYRLNISHDSKSKQDMGLPPTGDMSFTGSYRNDAWVKVPKYNNTLQEGTSFSLVRVASVDRQIRNGVSAIIKNLKDKPLKEGEQLNLTGYSYGSVAQAHIALALADKGYVIDNLILVGSPISTDSNLYKELLANKNIKKVIREDIKGDKLSNPSSLMEFTEGAKQNSSDSGAHFDLARPDNPDTKNVNEEKQADKNIDKFAKKLKSQGVE